MKKLIGVGVLCAVLSGNEIERIESIVNDVTQLRQEYESCRQRLESADAVALKSSEARFDAQRERYEAKIAILEAALEKSQEEERMAKRSLDHASLQVSQLNQLVSEQKCHIAALNGAAVSKPKPVTVEPAAQTVCPDVNPFPKLLMKERAAKAEKQPVKTVEAEAGDTLYFEASPFRLKADADIYDAPGGNIVAHWEERTSFTSNQKRNGWIRITGYFVEKKWRPSGEESLWVEETLARRR